MSNDLPGFDFSKVDILSAGTPQPVSMAESAKLLAGRQPADFRSFHMSTDGEITTTGYSPDEVRQLMKDYREHVITFSRAMQELQMAQTTEDAVRYSPVGPEDTPETFGNRRNR